MTEGGSPQAIGESRSAARHRRAETLAVNAYAKLDVAASVIDHNVVKVGENGNALMFSRQPIPYPRASSELPAAA